jgi:DHA1 family bicyclomycin/chloramphenicol resistance-like MFS transporter
MSPVATPVKSPVMSERRLSLIGGLLVALGPISLSLYTPALPELVHVFGTDVATVKLTLTTYFGGFAFAQLVCGPLADAYGRRRIAFVFTFIYLLGSLAACFAPSIEWLLAARLVQGVGAAAGVSVARAMVRDLYTGDQSVRIMNMIGVLLAIGPAISPTLGGIALDLLGWQAIFAFMLLYGLMLMVLLATSTRETLAHPDPSKIRPGPLLRNYGRLVASSAFLAPSIVFGCTAGALYTMATLLPFVLIDVAGLTPTQFGFSMIAQSGSYMLGAVLMRRLLQRFEAHRLVPVGLFLILLGGAGLAILLRLTEPSFLTVMGPVAVFAMGIAFISPSMQTAALASFPDIAGSAAALMGFVQMGGGFLGSAISAWMGHPVEGLSTIIPIMCALAVIVHYGMRALHLRRVPDRTVDRIVAPAE